MENIALNWVNHIVHNIGYVARFTIFRRQHLKRTIKETSNIQYELPIL